MSAAVVVSTSGFKALDEALAELPKATARNVLKRTLVKAGEPIAQKARDLVPVASGDLKDSIAVSAKIKNKVGNAEFAEAMRQGLGKGAAVQALRDARRGANASFAEMYVGPAVPQGFYGHLVEFGTSHMAAEPFMRPAWDAEQRTALDIIRSELGSQIIAAAKRLARSKKQSADVKYRASLAALMAVEAGG
jgi:HK97 gp10 family phage protein